jgi:magnesium-transporting ATPase (P-type)
VLGVLCAAIAFLLAMFLVWTLSWVLYNSNGSRGLWLFLATVFLLVWFFSLVAYRLLRDRTNVYGSVLPPKAWYIIAILFCVAGIAFVVLAISTRESAPLGGSLCSWLLALLAYGAGSHFASKRGVESAA